MHEDFAKPTHTEASLKAKPAKSPFGYYGAKQRIARRIIETLPPHNAWVEAFCGSAALTLAKAPAPIEVINDLDGEIVNLFSQLRNNAKALCEAVALTPYARSEFELARKSAKNQEPLERARCFLVATMMTINGTIGSDACGFSFSQSYSRGGKEARVNRWYNLPERLEKIVERLRGVRIENRDARDLLQMFADRPATLVYLDPPYYMKRDLGYVIDAKDQQFHLDLLNNCQKSKCMILISGYSNDLYEGVLTSKSGWTKITIETHTRDTSGKNHARNEILWMNGSFVEAKKSGIVPIILSEKEIHEKKINPSR